MTRRLIIVLLLMLTIAGITAAQTSGGQICIRAFEDRNGNGTQDGNEPPITRGLSVALIRDGIIIETALIENSPNASSGTLCFQHLEADQYSMRVSSADYRPTTTDEDEFIAMISDTGVPVVFPFAGQVIPIEVPLSNDDPLSLSPSEQRSFLIKLTFALIGAVVIMGAMTVVGAIIYFAFLRKPSPKYATGSYGAVPGTGSYAPVPDSGSYLPPTLDDTDQAKAVSAAEDDAYAMYDDDTDLPQSRPTVAAPPNPYGDTPDDDFSFEADDEDSDSAFRPPEE